MDSCIYEGRVKHRRIEPAVHSFSYRLFMMYLDLDELPALFAKRRFWSTSGAALARFRRSDHLGPNEQPLAESVRDLVEAETGRRPAGRIRLLTNLSYFGYRFNPVSFYYCFTADGENVEAIVAEVNNTPWGEQDTYVLPCTAQADGSRAWRFSPEKKMHVSPFMPMDVTYDWVLARPQSRLTVHMTTSKDGKRFFDASMNMQRTEITAASLASVLVRFPLLTVRIIVAIHWQAVRLWLKRCPVYVHPKKKRELATDS